jgi:hypothetical protein
VHWKHDEGGGWDLDIVIDGCKSTGRLLRTSDEAMHLFETEETVMFADDLDDDDVSPKHHHHIVQVWPSAESFPIMHWMPIC